MTLPPKADKRHFTLTLHGDTRVDDYYWLRDDMRRPVLNGPTNDSQVLYYVHKHKKMLLPYQVWRHVVGTPTTQDELIYEEQDDTFYVRVHKTTSERYILIALGSTKHHLW